MDARKKYVVTGGAGFIGSHVTEALLREGHAVIVADDLSTGKQENIPGGAIFSHIDVAHEKDAFTALCKGADGVFHLAAIAALQRSIEHPLDTNSVNIIGTLNVLLSARDAGVKRLVFTSSCAVYANNGDIVKREDMATLPENPYGLEKLVGEHYTRLFSSLYGLETISLRYFNVYGPRMAATGGYASVMKNFLDRFTAKQPLSITGDGEQTRDFVHVSDVAQANLIAMQNPDAGKGEIINVGSGTATSINHLAELVGGASVDELKANDKIIYIPVRSGEVRFIAADITHAQSLLGWNPKKSLEAGIDELKHI